MIRGRIVLPVLLAVAVALRASAGAGASGQGVQRIDLSSRAAINTYLRSIGVDPSGVVVQRGARVYAGANCPGKGWTCTRATRVLQLATAQNKFECTPVAAQAGGTDQGANELLPVTERPVLLVDRPAAWTAERRLQSVPCDTVSQATAARV